MSYSERAQAAYCRISPKFLFIAEQAEVGLAQVLRGRVTPKAAPFDIIVDDLNIVIELKTLLTSKNDGQIFVNKKAAARKSAYVLERGFKPYMVAIDYRHGEPVYYVREGTGSYRLQNMRRCSSARALRLYLIQCAKAETGLSPQIA